MTEEEPHGTTYRYRRGCDCDDCCAAWRRRWDAPPNDDGDDSDGYARSHGIAEANVLAPNLARALRRGQRVLGGR